MNKDPLILAFDCGTQSTRAMLFNKTAILSQNAKSFEPYFSEKGLGEQDADFIGKNLPKLQKIKRKPSRNGRK